MSGTNVEDVLGLSLLVLYLRFRPHSKNNPYTNRPRHPYNQIVHQTSYQTVYHTIKPSKS